MPRKGLFSPQGKSSAKATPPTRSAAQEASGPRQQKHNQFLGNPSPIASINSSKGAGYNGNVLPRGQLSGHHSAKKIRGYPPSASAKNGNEQAWPSTTRARPVLPQEVSIPRQSIYKHFRTWEDIPAASSKFPAMRGLRWLALEIFLQAAPFADKAGVVHCPNSVKNAPKRQFQLSRHNPRKCFQRLPHPCSEPMKSGARACSLFGIFSRMRFLPSLARPPACWA